VTCFCLTPQTEFSLHEPTAGSHDYSLFWSCVCDLFLFGVCVGVGGVVLSVCVCVCVTCFSLTSQAEFSLHEPTAGSHAGSHDYSPTHSYAELPFLWSFVVLFLCVCVTCFLFDITGRVLSPRAHSREPRRKPRVLAHAFVRGAARRAHGRLHHVRRADGPRVTTAYLRIHEAGGLYVYHIMYILHTHKHTYIFSPWPPLLCSPG